MNPEPPPARALRVLILKEDRLYAEMLRDTLQRALPGSRVGVAGGIGAAAQALAGGPLDLLLSGARLTGGDTVDFLSACTVPPRRVRHVLVVTTRWDPQLLARLRAVAVDGVFDQAVEGVERLAEAVRAVTAGHTYWSETYAHRLQQEHLAMRTLDRRLTPTERLVLAVIGDGCDDRVAADRLDLKETTIHSIRRALHRKLGVQQRGDLVRLAVQHGFVRFEPAGVVRPGFEAMRAAWAARRARRGDAEPRENPQALTSISG